MESDSRVVIHSLIVNERVLEQVLYQIAMFAFKTGGTSHSRLEYNLVEYAF